MRRTLVILLLFTAPLSAQSGLAPPRVGYVRDGGDLLRPVLGIRANFILGDAVIENVRSAAFSGRSGLVRTGGEILVLDEQARIVIRQPVAGGDALFAFSADGSPGMVYLRETAELYRCQPEGLEPVPWDPSEIEGRVLSVGVFRAGLFSLVTDRGDGLWLLVASMATGRVRFQALLPGVSAPVLLRPDGGLLYAERGDLVIREPGATERRLPLPVAAAALEQMGEGWIHVRTSDDGPGLALRLNADGEQLYRLPGAGQ